MARKTYQPRPLNLAHETEFFRLVQVPQTDGENRRGFVAGVACQPGDEPDFLGAQSRPQSVEWAETLHWRAGYRDGRAFRQQMLRAASAPSLPGLHRKMFLAVLGEAQRVGKAALA